MLSETASPQPVQGVLQESWVCLRRHPLSLGVAAKGGWGPAGTSSGSNVSTPPSTTYSTTTTTTTILETDNRPLMKSDMHCEPIARQIPSLTVLRADDPPARRPE